MNKKLTPNQIAYRKLVDKHGKAEIARFAGVTRQALSKWDAVPADRVLQVAESSGLKPEVIRPEPYAHP